MKLGLSLRSAVAIALMSGSVLATPPTTTATVTIGSTVTKAPKAPGRENSRPQDISFADCAVGSVLNFGVTRTGFVGNDLHIQVWAQGGVNCADDEVRDTNPACWKLTDLSDTAMSADIPVRDIIAQGMTALPAALKSARIPPASAKQISL